MTTESRLRALAEAIAPGAMRCETLEQLVLESLGGPHQQPQGAPLKPGERGLGVLIEAQAVERPAGVMPVPAAEIYRGGE